MRALLFNLQCLLIIFFALPHAFAEEENGKACIGNIKVAVIYASKNPANERPTNARDISKEERKILREASQLRFEHYLLLGEETQPLYRSYENWAQPLKPASEILVKFEASSAPINRHITLDLELWIVREKILKTDVKLVGTRPLYILGPAWRDGFLIISVSQAPQKL